MPAINHPAYNEELSRCKYILEYVDKALKSSLSRKERLEEEADRHKKDFSSDSSQSYIDTMISSMLQDSAALKVKNLITASNKPYFARADFLEDSKTVPEKLYIGKMSLMREEDQEVIIIDWRAPIANLYYEGRLGDAYYNCPDGEIKGQLLLKRQFSIEEGELREIFDIDITTNDEFLQSYLGANADNRLKEIVSTIQVEQNIIIRADMWKPLIVQGVAGSGKTTIALHRIAYLIYTYEKSFKPENFMIIAPNRFFLNYISEILPELGVERVKQTTFEEFAAELVGKLKIRDSNERLIGFVENCETDEQQHRNYLMKESSKLKASMDFKDIMDDFLETIENQFIPEENFKVGPFVLFTYQDINKLFLNDYKMWPFAKRMDEIKKHLNSRIKRRKDAMVNYFHEECDKKIMELKESMEDNEERHTLIVKAIDEKDRKIKTIELDSKKAVGDYIKKLMNISPIMYYNELFKSQGYFDSVLKGRVSTEVGVFMREYTHENLSKGFVDIEDIAPLVYLKYSIYGIDEKIPVRHIVIDEAQDFSPFQLYVIKKIIKDSSFTILGDLCQGIHSYRGINDWKDVTNRVFDDRKSKFLTLEQSYRTTVEIMDAANSVLKHEKSVEDYAGKPVIRHGKPVELIEMKDMKEIAVDIAGVIESFSKEGLKSVAIICKTLTGCKAIHQILKKHREDIGMITGKEAVYKGGFVVLPSYLSKGLEFDVVIIADASSEVYGFDELDIKLLYVAMTRGLHRLYIYFSGEASPLLKELRYG